MTGVAGEHRTSTKRNTHKTETLQVLYPWHPLHGQKVLVYCESDRSDRGHLFRCKLPSDTERNGLEVPAWMLDRVECSRMCARLRPQVSWESLVTLDTLLRRRSGNDADPVVQHRPEKGGADASPQRESKLRSSGAVSSGVTNSGMVRPERRGTGQGHKAAGTSAKGKARARARRARCL